MSYRYNGVGERVYRSGSNQTVHTVFDPNGHWIGDYDEYGQCIQQAIWLGDLPVGLIAATAGSASCSTCNRMRWARRASSSTPRAIVAVWRWELEHEAFGEELPNQDPDGDNTLFVLDLRLPGAAVRQRDGVQLQLLPRLRCGEWAVCAVVIRLGCSEEFLHTVMQSKTR